MTAVAYARRSWRPKACVSCKVAGETCPKCKRSNEEAHSCDVQMEGMRAFCRQRGWTLAPESEHRDDDKSGAEMDKRDGLKAAIAEAIKRKCPLVVWNESRLARNAADALVICLKLSKAGATLAFAESGTDTGTPEGWLLFGIKSLMAEDERRRFSIRTARGKRRNQTVLRVAQARPGFEAYGWMRDPADPKKLVRDPARWPHIVQIADWLKEGLNHKLIANRLNSAGIRKGKQPWRTRDIRRVELQIREMLQAGQPLTDDATSPSRPHASA